MIGSVGRGLAGVSFAPDARVIVVAIVGVGVAPAAAAATVAATAGARVRAGTSHSIIGVLTTVLCADRRATISSGTISAHRTTNTAQGVAAHESPIDTAANIASVATAPAEYLGTS